MFSYLFKSCCCAATWCNLIAPSDLFLAKAYDWDGPTETEMQSFCLYIFEDILKSDFKIACKSANGVYFAS
jgi:hypothetical protein